MRLYCLGRFKPLENSTHVVCTRKANGEAGHLAAKRIDGNVYLCAGSKNVHMLFRNKGMPFEI